MLKKHWIFATSMIIISIITVFSFYNVLTPEKKLPIYQPSMGKFQLVDSTIQHVKRFHKIDDFELINQNNDTVTNEAYDGKIYVADFFFTTCPTICPKMNQNLVDIQNTFPKRDDFGIASFTINPDYDTVEVMKNYADQYGVSNPNWHFLTGQQEDIYNLANLGFNLYAAEVEGAAGGFEHSGNFALIDRQGYIRSRTDDFGNPKIYYKGVISQKEQINDEGESEEISALKEDILKLLNHE